MQSCILRLSVDGDLYDELSDKLLAYQTQASLDETQLLSFWGFEIQSHNQALRDIKEQVSGFKQQMIIEVDTNMQEADFIYQYLREIFGAERFQASVYPLSKLGN